MSLVVTHHKGGGMSERVLWPLGGELRPRPYPDPEPGDPLLLFEIEIPVRVILSSPVAPAFFPRSEPTTRVSLEDVDLGVSDWRQLEGKVVTFSEDPELDAAVYLATVHNPVRLHSIRFGAAGAASIRAAIDLGFDFRCVKPRPPELEPSYATNCGSACGWLWRRCLSATAKYWYFGTWRNCRSRRRRR